jgi:hypothetical protein
MSGTATAVAERQDTSIFSFGRALRPTELALREHRAELAKASARVDAAEAAAANMRATLHAAEATAESTRAAIVNRQAEALAAAEAEAAYGDVDPKERKLRTAAEKNAFDSAIAVDAAKKALAAAEDRLRESQMRLHEVRRRRARCRLASARGTHEHGAHRTGPL